MPSMLKFVHVDDANSWANRWRTQRFRVFESLVRTIPRPMRILDVGGTNSFWQQRGWAGRDDVQIILLNLSPQDRQHNNITPVTGDATDLSRFEDASFHVVFSNSVIEHLFVFGNQQRMAKEIRRVARAFFGCKHPISGFPLSRTSMFWVGNCCLWRLE